MCIRRNKPQINADFWKFRNYYISETKDEFLNEKLKLDKDKVIGELASAEDGVELSGQRD